MDNANIIGRTTEIRRLKDYLDSGKAEFLVVYGRRRVGKTYLIKQFFKNTFSFYMSGAENATTKQQLFNFNAALTEYGKQFFPQANTWQEAFLQLRQYLESVKTSGRIVVFFDEMPWLDNAKSGFLSAFEYWWNTYASANPQIFLVVCGSSTSWLTKKILQNRGGLHNRVTRQFFLAPFTLHETELFFKSKKISMSPYQIAECYMIFGGVPYYLEQIEKQYSLYQNIDNLLFKKNGALRGEFLQLYSSLFKSSDKHILVVETLALKRKGLSREELVKYSKITDGGGLTRILCELEKCGFIAINNNFLTPKRNHLYQLTDFFSLFYINFVKNGKITDTSFWTNNINTPQHNAWAGFSFELLCQAHAEQIRKKLGISGVTTCTSSWRSRDKKDGAQIDLIIDRADNVINLCEMKFSKDEFVITKDYDKVLRHKLATFMEETKTRKAIHTTLITTYGAEHNEYWGNVQSEVILDDLMES